MAPDQFELLRKNYFLDLYFQKCEYNVFLRKDNFLSIFECDKCSVFSFVVFNGYNFSEIPRNAAL